MRGRKPLPTYMHVVNNWPGKHKNRRENKNEPMPPKGIPPAPEYLSEKAKVAWHAIAVKLDEIGVLTLLDAWALEQLAENHAEILKWRSLIAEKGEMLKVYITKGDYSEEKEVVNPACRMRADAEKRFRNMMVEFGLTPSSRSRVNATPKEKENADPAAKYF